MPHQRIAPESLSQAIQGATQSLACRTLVMAAGHYLYQAKTTNTFIDYYALHFALTNSSATSTAYLFTSAKYMRNEEHKSFLKAIEANQWQVKVVPESIPYEHIMLREALSRGIGSTYDSIAIISSVARMPELGGLRASGKHIVRCVFAKDVTQRMHQNADEIITLEELGVLY